VTKNLPALCLSSLMATLMLALPTSEVSASLVFTIDPDPINAIHGSSGTFDIKVENIGTTDLTLAHSAIVGGTTISSTDATVVTVSGSIAAIPFGSPITISASSIQSIGTLNYATIATMASTAAIGGGFGYVFDEVGADTPEIGTASFDVAFAAVPEPGTTTTFCAAIAGLCFRRRRRI